MGSEGGGRDLNLGNSVVWLKGSERAQANGALWSMSPPLERRSVKEEDISWVEKEKSSWELWELVLKLAAEEAMREREALREALRQREDYIRGQKRGAGDGWLWNWRREAVDGCCFWEA